MNRGTCTSCGMPLRAMRGGSLTQWISACACVSSGPTRARSGKYLACSRCRKRIHTGKRGSITSWVFQEDICSCVAPRAGWEDGSRFEEAPAAGDDQKGNSSQALPDLDDDSFPRERYEPRALLGIGDAGVVYLCLDSKSQNEVAVKVIHLPEGQELLWFQQEARATSRLNHPGIIKVLDFGVSDGGAPYMVMEYAPGVTLRRVLDSYGALSVDSALDIMTQILSALGHAHEEGMLHGDVCPENVIVVNDDIERIDIRLIDFGIARITGDTRTDGGGADQVMGGHVLYMAPDKVLGYDTTVRSEIYSLGCMFFEMLTGDTPFGGTTQMEVVEEHAAKPAPSLAQATGLDWPEAFESLVARALSKNPDERFGSAFEMQQAIKELTDQVGPAPEADEPVEVRVEDRKQRNLHRELLTVSFLAAMVLIVAGAVLYQSFQSDPIGSALEDYSRVSAENAEEPESPARDRSPEIKARKPFFSKRGPRPDSLRPVNWTVSARNATDVDLERLAGDTAIEYLDVSFSRINGSGFSRISHLPLLAVRANRCSLSRKGLVSLCSIQSLNSLDLEGVNGLDRESIQSIAGLSRLAHLSLRDCHLDDEEIEPLKALSGLRSLTVTGNSRITDGGLMPVIRANPRLSSLFLGGSGASLTSLGAIAEPGKMMALGITDIAITVEDIEKRLNYPNLLVLFLSGSHLKDDHIKALKKFKKLRLLLLLESPNVSEDAVFEFNQAVPRCRVSRV